MAGEAEMPSMLVLDAQIHVWGANTPARPWVPGSEQLAHTPTPFSAEFLVGEMDRVRVDRAFLVSPTWEGPRNDLVLEAARTYPDRFRAVTRFALDQPSNATHFQAWVENPEVVATRVVFTRDARVWLSDGTADWIWPAAERVGLPVMIYAPEQYSEIAQVARRHPSLRLSVCHLGLDTKLRDAEIDSEIDRLLELAAFENVSVKATSLPSFVTEAYPFPRLQHHMRRVVDEFGSGRVFWGSDLSRLACSYEDLYRFALEELTFLSEHELRNIIGQAASEWFRW